MIGGSEFNARSLPASEVASWFVPPETHFVPLLSRDHTVMVGPRGSGKTTLLKMLTINALENWDAPEAVEYINKIHFNAALVPGDRLWGQQVSEANEKASGLGEKIFVAHTVRALLRAMKDVTVASELSTITSTSHLHANMGVENEGVLADTLAETYGLSIRLRSLLGLIFIFDHILANTERLESSRVFETQNLSGLLSATISAFNELAGTPDRQWALLFDELEIAPEGIQSLLMSLIRSSDQRIIFKLALAPYTPYVKQSRPDAPHIKHDYNVVSLTYPNKEDSRIFSQQIAEKVFSSSANADVRLLNVFGSSAFRVNYNKGEKLPREFLSLAHKDESFAEHIKITGLTKRNLKNENERAQHIRKISPIVKTRDYYLSSFHNETAKRHRSRKSHDLYTGYPTILEVADGNPRALLTMLVPMARAVRYVTEIGRPGLVPRNLQADAVKRAEFLQASLLNVIPVEIEGNEKKGLLGFIDDIGRSLQARLISGPFKPDLYCSFNVDRDVTDKEEAAIGQALNVGAIIYVPHRDASPDGILKGIRGMRFRLSYSLSARFRLPLTLGEPLNLSALLKRAREYDDEQLTFFEK